MRKISGKNPSKTPNGCERDLRGLPYARGRVPAVGGRKGRTAVFRPPPGPEKVRPCSPTKLGQHLLRGTRQIGQNKCNFAPVHLPKTRHERFCCHRPARRLERLHDTRLVWAAALPVFSGTLAVGHHLRQLGHRALRVLLHDPRQPARIRRHRRTLQPVATQSDPGGAVAARVRPLHHPLFQNRSPAAEPLVRSRFSGPGRVFYVK